MDFDQTTMTTAGLAPAWAALSAVTTLPQWTRSMTTVQPLDGTTINVGCRFRIKQPGLPPVVWRVTDVRDGESFSWEARSPGVRTVGYHRLRQHPDGGTEIAIGLRQSGALAWLVGVVIAAKTRRYLVLEAAGLKAAAEAAAGQVAKPSSGTTGAAGTA